MDVGLTSLLHQGLSEPGFYDDLIYNIFSIPNDQFGMLKSGRMHRQTGEKFVDPTAMSRQMREVSDF